MNIVHRLSRIWVKEGGAVVTGLRIRASKGAKENSRQLFSVLNVDVILLKLSNLLPPDFHVISKSNPCYYSGGRVSKVSAIFGSQLIFAFP